MLNNSINALKLELHDRKAVCDFTMIVRVYGIRAFYPSFELPSQSLMTPTFIYESE